MLYIQGHVAKCGLSRSKIAPLHLECLTTRYRSDLGRHSFKQCISQGGSFPRSFCPPSHLVGVGCSRKPSEVSYV